MRVKKVTERNPEVFLNICCENNRNKGISDIKSNMGRKKYEKNGVFRGRNKKTGKTVSIFEKNMYNRPIQIRGYHPQIL